MVLCLIFFAFFVFTDKTKKEGDANYVKEYPNVAFTRVIKSVNGNGTW